MKMSVNYRCCIKSWAASSLASSRSFLCLRASSDYVRRHPTDLYHEQLLPGLNILCVAGGGVQLVAMFPRMWHQLLTHLDEVTFLWWWSAAATYCNYCIMLLLSSGNWVYKGWCNTLTNTNWPAAGTSKCYINIHKKQQLFYLFSHIRTSMCRCS